MMLQTKRRGRGGGDDHKLHVFIPASCDADDDERKNASTAFFPDDEDSGGDNNVDEPPACFPCRDRWRRGKQQQLKNVARPGSSSPLS